MNKDKRVVTIDLDEFKKWCKELINYHENELSSDYTDGIGVGLRMAIRRLEIEEEYNEQG